MLLDTLGLLPLGVVSVGVVCEVVLVMSEVGEEGGEEVGGGLV